MVFRLFGFGFWFWALLLGFWLRVLLWGWYNMILCFCLICELFCLVDFAVFWVLWFWLLCVFVYCNWLLLLPVLWIVNGNSLCEIFVVLIRCLLCFASLCDNWLGWLDILTLKVWHGALILVAFVLFLLFWWLGFDVLFWFYVGLAWGLLVCVFCICGLRFLLIWTCVCVWLLIWCNTVLRLFRVMYLFTVFVLWILLFEF